VELPGAALSIARPARLPITLLVSHWQAEWAHADVARPAAMIFIRDPEKCSASVTQMLIALHGLTKAEAVVATAIGRGKSPEDIAAGLGVGMGTVRTHLKKALAKTGTRRQAALAALVANGVGGISA
jgi:DNA-binding CsgD family transcriptional regulator